MSAFYILSLKHTNYLDEHIRLWGRFHRGYTPVIGDRTGRYCFAEAQALNDGLDCLAVPTAVVEGLMSPEPYWKPGARMYDQRGPVLNNTRAIWNRLIAGSLQDGRHEAKVKPEFFRGKRRAITWSEPQQELMNESSHEAEPSPC